MKKLQWDAVHEPAVWLGFGTDKDGMEVNGPTSDIADNLRFVIKKRRIEDKEEYCTMFTKKKLPN